MRAQAGRWAPGSEARTLVQLLLVDLGPGGAPSARVPRWEAARQGWAELAAAVSRRGASVRGSGPNRH